MAKNSARQDLWVGQNMFGLIAVSLENEQIVWNGIKYYLKVCPSKVPHK